MFSSSQADFPVSIVTEMRGTISVLLACFTFFSLQSPMQGLTEAYKRLEQIKEFLLQNNVPAKSFELIHPSIERHARTMATIRSESGTNQSPNLYK